MNTLLRFYAGVGTDNVGRTLEQVLAWKDETLEYTHDYIQWLFPNRQASQFNLNAPLLTDDDVKHFRKSPELIENIRRAHARMCKFYKIAVGPPFWWDDLRYSHNWLRMTRIMLCLCEVGLMKEADEFHSAISQASLPDTRTRSFWFAAAGKPTDP